ncbi:MAG TPA: hypothetical protein VFX16_12200 [Pseudonocardiaceae bacterium]|nr:hypothetical protein [Pseudonocardiaceae bacterium]
MSDPLRGNQPDLAMMSWPHLRAVPEPGDDLAMRRGALVGDLKKLRRGRGIFASHIDKQVGPALREFALISDDDGPAEIRIKVAQRVSSVAEDLPADLRAAMLTALAIAPDARQPVYKDRVGLAATRIRRDPRTARRRIDEAIEQLAQRATAKPGFTGPIAASSISRSRIGELRLSLVLDRARPEIVEQCRFTAEQEHVGEIATVTHRLAGFAELDTDALSTDVLYGGTFDPAGTAETRRTPVVRLPKRLGIGETHEYVVRSVLLPADQLPSEVRFSVDDHCDRLEIRVRFDLARMPGRIESIEDNAYPLRPDEAGEVLATFTGLTPGDDCGIRWE